MPDLAIELEEPKGWDRIYKISFGIGLLVFVCVELFSSREAICVNEKIPRGDVNAFPEVPASYELVQDENTGIWDYVATDADGNLFSGCTQAPYSFKMGPSVDVTIYDPYLSTLWALPGQGGAAFLYPDEDVAVEAYFGSAWTYEQEISYYGSALLRFSPGKFLQGYNYTKEVYDRADSETSETQTAFLFDPSDGAYSINQTFYGRILDFGLALEPCENPAEDDGCLPTISVGLTARLKSTTQYDYSQGYVKRCTGLFSQIDCPIMLGALFYNQGFNPYMLGTLNESLPDLYCPKCYSPSEGNIFMNAYNTALSVFGNMMFFLSVLYFRKYGVVKPTMDRHGNIQIPAVTGTTNKIGADVQM